MRRNSAAQMKPKPNFTKEKLVKWIDGDAFKEAKLITEVPVKASTLGRIKNGSYVPSVRLANALNTIIEGE